MPHSEVRKASRGSKEECSQEEAAFEQIVLEQQELYRRTKRHKGYLTQEKQHAQRRRPRKNTARKPPKVGSAG